MTHAQLYTTQLQAGLGMIAETRTLLELWQPGMSNTDLQQESLNSGHFPNITARRLRNIVSECFATRYLVDDGRPARHLKQLLGTLSSTELSQLMLLYTSRANPILRDFIAEVYWSSYEGGLPELSSEDARRFVERAIDDGKTSKRWSETTVRRMSAYLTGCCADFGLLESGTRSVRRLLPFRILPGIVTYLAYDLHFAGFGDNALLSHQDWALFGLEAREVMNELQRTSRQGNLIVQAAGDIVRISWLKHDMNEVLDVLT